MHTDSPHGVTVDPAASVSSRLGPGRIACLLIAGVFAVVAWGAYFRLGWTTALWPWSDVKMTYVFLASIAVAIAAPVLWTGISGDLAALAPVAIQFTIAQAGMAVYLAARAWRHDEPRLLIWGALLIANAAGTALLYGRLRAIGLKDERRMPRAARGIFVILVIVLGFSGTALLFQVDNIYPFDLKPETSTMIGWIFLGAGFLFGYIVVRPFWAYGEIALVSFLAYDIVLFIPYSHLLRKQPGGGTYNPASMYGPGSTTNSQSLHIYLIVLGLSSLVAIYYLAINPGTRVRR